VRWMARSWLNSPKNKMDRGRQQGKGTQILEKKPANIYSAVTLIFEIHSLRLFKGVFYCTYFVLGPRLGVNHFLVEMFNKSSRK